MRHCKHCNDEEFVENPKLLWFAFLITFTFFWIELVGGWWTNSWALISDSFHMATDASALLIGAGASSLAKRLPAYGLKIKNAAAVTNALFLIGLSVIVVIRSYERLWIPYDILSLPMLAIAVIGLGINLFELVLLRHQAYHDLNTRGAYMHVMGDSAGSIGAITAAVIIYFWTWTPADAIAAFLVGILMFIAGIQILKASVSQLLQH